MPHSGIALIDPSKIFEKIDLSAGMRVADLGCGRTGHFVFPASKVVGEKGVVYAIDIIKNILESIESRKKSEGYDNVEIVWSDLERCGLTPIPDNSLDACFIVNVLYLAKDKENFLKEAKRLIKEGGYLVLTDWDKKIGPLGPSEDMILKKENVILIAEKLGFKLVDSFLASSYHYCLIFKK